MKVNPEATSEPNQMYFLCCLDAVTILNKMGAIANGKNSGYQISRAPTNGATERIGSFHFSKLDCIKITEMNAISATPIASPPTCPINWYKYPSDATGKIIATR